MLANEIKTLLAATFTDAQIDVSIDGSHSNIQIISDVFAGVMPVKKQQMVYAIINDLIADGTLHAVNMQLHTPEQWQKLQG